MDDHFSSPASHTMSDTIDLLGHLSILLACVQPLTSTPGFFFAGQFSSPSSSSLFCCMLLLQSGPRAQHSASLNVALDSAH